ncbi:MAG: NADH-quinone oxidoreductase subunit NuoG [Desulfuromonadales bacterium]|nr:NADH-quinone oxidoreductase subunit NuoG [Desulfuromonadales bacterium]
MPKLIIDNIAVEVPEGTNVLEAARSVGITIPHFCWHPALGKAGACRVCAVKLLDGPVKGLQMSCMLPAQDGMVVSTSDEEAVAMRRSVIEWLMINHPHDCPVCDEGGECQLQDFTIAGGHGLRRYDGRKRTHVNQYLGDQIEHEMNRCIQCYRCVRFYQEYAGGTDFGVTGRAASVYFGRDRDGALESPFSGNLVDICPTGVFTDKTARFRARYWDYDMAPSVCPHCSLGCNTVPMARYRELLKTTARHNDTVNGWFICDRGRFSNAIVNAPDRPRQALVDGSPVTMEQALDTLADRLAGFLELHGPESLAIVGSPRMSLEGNIMAARLRNGLGAGAVCYFTDQLQAARTMQAASLLTTANAASQDDVRRADLVAIMACDLLDEAPMLALAVRQSWRDGARVYVVPFDSAQGPISAQGADSIQKEGFVQETSCRLSGVEATLPFEFKLVTELADIPFNSATRPVIICGTRQTSLNEIQSAICNGVKTAFVLDGPNAFGCALLAQEQGPQSLEELLSNGQIKGIISLEADLPGELPEGVQVLAAADWQNTSAIAKAGIVLPTTAWIEMDGTFVNHEGRAQRFRQVMKPGLPIKGLTPELHPPRVHRHDAPGGDVLPAWRIVTELLGRIGDGQVEGPLTGRWEGLQGLDAEGEGRRLVEAA